MKKYFAGLLAAVFCIAMTASAFASEIRPGGSGKGNTELTYSQVASYTVVIPEKAEIIFDKEESPIGSIEYQYGNLERDSYVTVTLAGQTPLVCQENTDCTIDYEIWNGQGIFESVRYDEDTPAGTRTDLTASISREEWERAKAGNYAATLTFMISYRNPHEDSSQP